MLKSQAAMEYLMTYGWALLIIAVVLGVLYSFGVFNANTYAAYQMPGSCQISRPNGPGSLNLINFQGACLQELPRTVAFFKPSVGSIVIPSTQIVNVSSNAITVSVWLYANSTLPATQIAISKASTSSSKAFIFPETTNGWTSIVAKVNTNPGGWQSVTAPYNGINRWHNVVMTYNGAVLDLYIDGSLAATGAVTGALTLSSSNLTLGYEQGAAANWFGGRMSNLQIYNNSLGSNAIQSLYLEGIGGDPVNLQFIAGWWPLNSDAIDYSENGGTGTVNGIIFSTSWTSGYVTP